MSDTPTATYTDRMAVIKAERARIAAEKRERLEREEREERELAFREEELARELAEEEKRKAEERERLEREEAERAEAARVEAARIEAERVAAEDEAALARILAGTDNEDGSAEPETREVASRRQVPYVALPSRGKGRAPAREVDEATDEEEFRPEEGDDRVSEFRLSGGKF
jgi:IgA-specific serine endopeptidase